MTEENKDPDGKPKSKTANVIRSVFLVVMIALIAFTIFMAVYRKFFD